MKKKHKLFMTIILVSLILFQTVVYCAIESHMIITGESSISMISDARIAGFSIHETSTGVVSHYEEFYKDNVKTDVELPYSDSYIIFKIDVINHSKDYRGISRILDLDSNLTYELIDYKLDDKICDINGKCNNGAKKTFYLKIKYKTYNSNHRYQINLRFIFKGFHKINYYNIVNHGYPQDVIDGGNLNIKFINDIPVNVFASDDDGITKSFYSNNTLDIFSVSSDLSIDSKNIYEFDYTGNYQEFKVNHNATYKVELWGARGGSNDNTGEIGGDGAYVSGEINLKRGEKIYVYVGENPTYTSGECYNENPNAGFNSAIQGSCAGGGGATDIRLVSGTWDTFDSLKSRIMVAAGGGGGTYKGGTGGAGGGLSGYEGIGVDSSLAYTGGLGGSQTSRYFGISNKATNTGGGGYYTGEGGYAKNAGGGSSFISGHIGCDAIAENSVEFGNIHTGQPVHYSGYKFTRTKMIDGLGYQWYDSKADKVGMPNPRGQGTIDGNRGDGFAKITILDYY